MNGVPFPLLMHETIGTMLVFFFFFFGSLLLYRWKKCERVDAMHGCGIWHEIDEDNAKYK